jgi:uncharacterized membrane protein
MKNIYNFVKDIIIGGVLFFIPLIILIVILQKALQIAAVLVVPIIKLLNVTHIFGIGVEIVISIVTILFVLYLAGLIARTKKAKAAITKLEDSLLSKVPGYDMIKSTGASFVGFEENSAYKTVLARIEDAWQYGFLIEEIEGDQCAVYIPGAPNPMSGSVYILENNRIKKTNIPLSAAMKSLRGLGKGSNELVKNYL